MGVAPAVWLNAFQAAFLHSLFFCQRRRFAAYHEQGQAPAPRSASTIGSSIKAV